MKFNLPPSWLKAPIKVFLIGAGGNGSHMLDGLVTLHYSLIKLGHPYGLDVSLFDPDEVSESNIARSQFYQQDVGLNKAIVLMNRLNQFHNLNWSAYPLKFSKQFLPNFYSNSSVLTITCVDSISARRDIHHILSSSPNTIHWLDMGNGDSFGNVIFGEVKSKVKKYARDYFRLPTVVELYPEFLDASLDSDTDEPSCSVFESLEKQGMFINKAVATFALYLLSALIRDAGLDSHHGYFINMKDGRVNPLPIDENVWRRMQGKKPKIIKKTI